MTLRATPARCVNDCPPPLVLRNDAGQLWWDGALNCATAVILRAWIEVTNKEYVCASCEGAFLWTQKKEGSP